MVMWSESIFAEATHTEESSQTHACNRGDTGSISLSVREGSVLVHPTCCGILILGRHLFAPFQIVVMVIALGVLALIIYAGYGVHLIELHVLEDKLGSSPGRLLLATRSSRSCPLYA